VSDDVADELRALGLPEEAIQRAIARGDPESAIFDSALLPEIADRTVSARDIAASGGPDPEQMQLFWEAFGLPFDDPDERMFSEAEAEAFRVLKQNEGVWRPELGIQVSRVYGRLLARIAQAELQIFRVFIQPELAANTEDRMASLAASRDLFAQLLPVSGVLLLAVHRRWLEHHLAQEAVREAEVGGVPLPGAVDVSFLFVDLKEFTAFAQARGDEAAVAAIDSFTAVVVGERGPGSVFTKALGDGYMLAYRHAYEAVAAGRRIIDGMKDLDAPGVHSSVHRGVAIAREGDYFGTSVNLASRLLDAAEADELVATTEAVHAAGDAFSWKPAGDVRVRGIAEPVSVFRLDC
jgi:adenylate cyclase